MHLILEYYEEWKSTYNQHPILISMVNARWKKIDKYYNLTDSSPAYIASIILDPNLKWQYLEEHWTSKEIKGAKKILKEYWNKYYKPQGIYLFISLDYSYPLHIHTNIINPRNITTRHCITRTRT